MTDSVVQQFAALLRNEPDAAKRAGLIKRAELLAVNDLPADAFEPPVQTLGEYLDTPIEVPASLVWPTICVRGEVTVTLGRGGKGKTSMNQNRIFKWAAGKPLFDTFRHHETNEVFLRPEAPLKTLIIENEGAAAMFHQKIGVMINNSDGVITANEREMIRNNIFIWGSGGYSNLKLDDPKMLTEVRAGIEKVRPDIVFIEPFRSLWRGEENSSTDMAKVVDGLIGVATDLDCAIIMSHHERKGAPVEGGDEMDRARGSSYLEGVVALMEHYKATVGGDYRELSWSKARYLQPPPPVRFQYDQKTGWYRHVAEGEIEQRVISVFHDNDGESLTLVQLSEETEETITKLRKICNDLAKRGTLKKMRSESDGNGSTGNRYRLIIGEEENDEGLSIG